MPQHKAAEHRYFQTHSQNPHFALSTASAPLLSGRMQPMLNPKLFFTVYHISQTKTMPHPISLLFCSDFTKTDASNLYLFWFIITKDRKSVQHHTSPFAAFTLCFCRRFWHKTTSSPPNLPTSAPFSPQNRKTHYTII